MSQGQLFNLQRKVCFAGEPFEHITPGLAFETESQFGIAGCRRSRGGAGAGAGAGTWAAVGGVGEATGAVEAGAGAVEAGAGTAAGGWLSGAWFAGAGAAAGVTTGAVGA